MHRDGSLPLDSFIEPSFTIDPNDEHPPHDVRLGEQFIHDVYQAVSTGRDWEQTLLLITYDEHGGCYDHVPPPWNATPPDPESNPGEAGFCFNRFGVRVPALLISPYIEAGTVFRSTTSVPYDHTSILATILRDWLNTPSNKMLRSARIKAAPGFANVLSRTTPRTDRAGGYAVGKFRGLARNARHRSERPSKEHYDRDGNQAARTHPRGP